MNPFDFNLALLLKSVLRSSKRRLRAWASSALKISKTSPVSYRNFAEQGSVMAEGAISFAAVVILMIGVFELGGGLNQQLTVSRIAYEGARYASSLAGLENCAVNCSALPVHRTVLNRINLLLTQSGFSVMTAQLNTTFDATTREISVSVGVPFRSVFRNPYFTNTVSQVKSTHLFPSSVPIVPVAG